MPRTGTIAPYFITALMIVGLFILWFRTDVFVRAAIALFNYALNSGGGAVIMSLLVAVLLSLLTLGLYYLRWVKPFQ